MAKYGESAVYKGGLDIFTTLNVRMQTTAELALAPDFDNSINAKAGEDHCARRIFPKRLQFSHHFSRYSFEKG